MFGALGVSSLVGPAVLRIQDTVVHARHMFRDVEVERLGDFGLAVQQFAVEDGGDDGAGGLQRDALADAVAAADPARVDQVGRGVMLVQLLGQLLRILGRVQQQEGCAEAGGEVGCGVTMPRSVPASLAV